MINQAESGNLPFDVRREMVNSLFGRYKVLISGFVAHVFCILVCWAATDDPSFFAWGPAFAAIMVYRFSVLWAYEKRHPDISTETDLARWERLYILGGVLVALCIGTCAGYAVITAPNTIAPAIGMGLVGGSMISVVGRNFSSMKNARLMTFFCCLPLVVGFLVGGWLHNDYLVALTCIPLFIVMTTSVEMSRYLNGLLVGALKASRRSEVAFQRFDAAISSMPNGLLIVDGNHKVVSFNARAAFKLGIADMKGMKLEDVLRSAVLDVGSLMEALLLPHTEQDDFDTMTFEAVGGRHLRFRLRHLEGRSGRFLDTEWGGRQEGAFVLTILDVTRKVESDRRIQHLARYDGLTGIANRTYWEETTPRLISRLAPDALVGLAVLDIDRFKLINDTLGHDVGDKVIAGVAARLGKVDSSRMFVGRLGGDEFVVLATDLKDVEDAGRLFDKMFASISGGYDISGQNVEVRCSGGVIIRSRSGFNLHADMSRADMALYTVKRMPDRAWRLFDDAMEDEFQSTTRIKHDLKAAIDGGLLEVVYQPIYDAADGRAHSAEALCRWMHAEVGPIPPSQFVAMAEEIGVIGKLTEYVLGIACRDCMTWSGDMAVSVNLSALDLAKDGVVEMIEKALADNSMPPSRLCVEVTETVFVKDFAKTAATLMHLKDIGVKTSLDDFGTGYSSLSYMDRLPLNRVKIDRSFVTKVVEDAKAFQLFSAVVGLAKGLGFEVVVEGVERKDQFDKVVSVQGVDMIQGHVFSGAMASEELARLSAPAAPRARGGSGLRIV